MRAQIFSRSISVRLRNSRDASESMWEQEVTICAALKCNGYGFGLLRVARTVLTVGADMLSMVDPANAIEFGGQA